MADFSSVILVIVNLDYRYQQSGWVNLSLDELGLEQNQVYQVKDLLAGVTYQWQGARNYVALDPRKIPAHVFLIDRGTGGKKKEKVSSEGRRDG